MQYHNQSPQILKLKKLGREFNKLRCILSTGSSVPNRKLTLFPLSTSRSSICSFGGKRKWEIKHYESLENKLSKTFTLKEKVHQKYIFHKFIFKILFIGPLNCSWTLAIFYHFLPSLHTFYRYFRVKVHYENRIKKNLTF